MKKKFFATAAAVAFAALAVASPAQAATWPGDDVFVVGDAKWQLSAYGLYYAWDANDQYNNDGYLYYPNEFYAGDYFYCTGDTEGYADSVVTDEANGDITVTCPVYSFDGAADVTSQLVFRMYATENNGWLIREELIVTNNGSSDYVLENMESYQYPASYTYNNVDGEFVTSSGASSTELTAADSWVTTAIAGGGSVVHTAAWALTGSVTGIESSGDISNGDDLVSAFGDQFIPAGRSLRFLQFSNMVIPASPYFSSGPALATAAAQVSEFATFSGRLVEGLPADTFYVGWGTTPSDSPAAQSGSAALASTGTDAGTVSFAAGLSALALVAGASIVVYRRKARSA